MYEKYLQDDISSLFTARVWTLLNESIVNIWKINKRTREIYSDEQLLGSISSYDTLQSLACKDFYKTVIY